jgi:hypothetical protein
LTTEQLNQARADLWHQAGNSLLTADDATAWLRETGICLFLPRTQQLSTAAPSFVEAVLGATNPTPAPDAIASAWELLTRLLAARDAIALNLLGNNGLGLAGEQPDFLATSETLPFLCALRGDKEWKRGPRGKSSPLTIEVWKLLDREGPLTAEEVKDKLGRQLTEAAALRALGELWSHLRIEPIFTPGEATGWQLLERRWSTEMQAGSNLSQAVALSALVSLYLQSTVAASEDEVEIFLSPLASRSKVREVVRGLTATRQLTTINLGPVEMFHIAGTLPEFPEIAHAEGAVVVSADGEEGTMGEGRRRFVARRLAAGVHESESGSGEEGARPARPTAPRPASRPAAGGAERRPFAPGAGSSAARPGSSERRPYGTRNPSGGSSFNPREPWKEDAKPAARSAEESSERRPFAAREGSERRPFAPREGGERKSFAPREGGERKSFTPHTGDRPFKPRSEVKPFGERKSFGDRKPFSPRGDGERKPFAPREGGERKSFAPRAGDRPFKPRAEGKPFGERKSFGDRKPYTPREGGERKPFSPRGDGDRKPFTPREGGERKSFAPRSGDRPFKSRPAAGAGGAGATRRPAGTGRPTSSRPGTKSAGADRARTSSFTSSGKPRTGARTPTGRPGPRATRSARPAGRPGVKRTGRPKKGPGK